LAEGAIVVTVFLVLVFGTIDIGIAVFRHSTISNAARQGARTAAVHGALANQKGVWGTATATVAATANDPKADCVRPLLGGCNLSATNITMEWPQNSNAITKPVRVTVTTGFNPIMTFIFGNPTFTLSASSTMPISH
jgi:Flp pilus assembly protein TadG